MLLTYLMVVVYCMYCVRVVACPARYFQLNSRFFNDEAGIFSKLHIDQLFPPQWRLAQYCIEDDRKPARYPVFVKPEWGQNAAGIYRADDAATLLGIREQVRGSRVKYLVQEGATGRSEYEIFSLSHHLDSGRYSVLTVTQVHNDVEANPINSAYNKNTRYVEITGSFSEQQREQIWQYICRIGAFKISRLGVRTDSIDDLLQGKFSIIEINLFAPMPIHLLDKHYSRKQKMHIIFGYMLQLAKLTKHRDKSIPNKPVFLKTMLYNRNKLLSRLKAML